MVSKPLHIGLVGCGSRGLSIFERLLSIAETRPQQPLVIDIFDPNVFGTGAHWPDQPAYLLLNTVAGQLGYTPTRRPSAPCTMHVNARVRTFWTGAGPRGSRSTRKPAWWPTRGAW